MSDDEGEDNIDFQSLLKAWTIKSESTPASLNDLLNILSKKYRYIPKDSKNLLHTPRTVNYYQKWGDSFIFWNRKLNENLMENTD